MKERYFVGGIFITLGVLFLLSNFHILSLEKFWPIFVLGPGIGFILSFIGQKKNYGLLMPGTILTVIGILFFYCELTGWHSMEYLWPFFIIAPGIGFFAMYYFGERDKHLLIPASILSIIGFLFLALNNAENYTWPIILIIVGLWLLLFKNK
jgi:uncharacterized membrane protein HdeD (DUF308 family)